jgi:putative transposase
MERMNGEIRDREKTMRGLKVENTPILPGLQLYHNFVRPHEALNGQTPAEKAGIKIEGENKFLTLIQNAAMSKLETERKSPVMSK